MSLSRAAVLAFLVLSARVVQGQEGSERRPDAPHVTTLGADYAYQDFTGDIAAWHLASLSLGQRTGAGSLIARANYANRFAVSGTQLEVDAYPRLGSGSYAYLNAGYSAATIFPAWRFGGEVFTSLPGAWEASAGVRHLRFSGAPVTLLTGSVGKYVGNYWFSARPWVRSGSGSTSASASLTARRYYEDADNYIGARAGYGSTPNDQLTPDVIARASALSVALDGSRSLSRTLLGTWTLGFDREKLPSSVVRRSFTLAGGLRVRL